MEASTAGVGPAAIKPSKAHARVVFTHLPDGTLKSLDELQKHLASFRQKKPLQDACDAAPIKILYGKSTSVSSLQERLVEFWYPDGQPRTETIAVTKSQTQIPKTPALKRKRAHPAQTRTTTAQTPIPIPTILSVLPPSTSSLLNAFKAAIERADASCIPASIDGNDPLSAFGRDPSSYIDSALHGDDIWENGLNQLVHSVFGWAMTGDEIKALIRDGKSGVSGFYTFVRHFVEERGVGEGLFKEKVDLLTEALNALPSSTSLPSALPSSSSLSLLSIPSTPTRNMPAAMLSIAAPFDSDANIDPSLLRLPPLSGNPSTDIALISAAQIAAAEDTLDSTPRGTRRRQTPQRSNALTVAEQIESLSDAELLQYFGATDVTLQEVMGVADDDDEDEGEEFGGDDVDVDMPSQLTQEEREAYEREVRVAAADRHEQNRRVGGRRTQDSVVRDWNRFLAYGLSSGKLRDNIIDDHALLVYIAYSAEREKLDKRGHTIPGSRVGASQLKKLYFGVLRLRKMQEAEDPALKTTRPCRGGHVMDALKTRMDEALNREREGLGEDDAPDIVANTFLSNVDEGDLARIRVALLKHRELRLVVFGHVAWACQNASGNRGDDIRALKLCEIQHYTLLHPDRRTTIFALLGLQGEEKAGKKGLRTIINPVYTTFIAHRDPTMCPLGALAMYFHWLFDYFQLGEKFEIDWTVNKSWRRFRVLFGSDPEVPYSDTSLYNIYARAFKSAGFESKMKQHLPRHLLGYLQERQGVQAEQTSRLGWKREEQYGTTYAPQFPKQASSVFSCLTTIYWLSKAILGCAGYKDYETYDPTWRHVQVPAQFLSLICPMADDILSTVKGKLNLVGATKFWEAVIHLRPYLFQSAAAIYQICPKSALFRLPALARDDVRDWMSTVFPVELDRLQKAVRAPIDISTIQDRELRRVLEHYQTLLQHQAFSSTTPLSPAKGFSQDLYAKRLKTANTKTSAPVEHVLEVYSTPTANGSPHRACVQNMQTGERGEVPEPLQIDLVLPNSKAFIAPGEVNPTWPVILGNRSTDWERDIFPLVKQPDELWESWAPSRTLDKYKSVTDVWSVYNTGEAVFDEAGNQTGMKPPLRLVEQYFQAKWRPQAKMRKNFGRFREIPEWIDQQSKARSVSPRVVIAELEERREQGGDPLRDDDSEGGKTTAAWGLSALQKWVKRCREEEHVAQQAARVAAHAASPLLPAFGDEESVPHIHIQKKRAAPVAPRGKYKKLRVD